VPRAMYGQVFVQCRNMFRAILDVIFNQVNVPSTEGKLD